MIEEENIQSSDDLIDEDDDVLESRLQQLATEELNQTATTEGEAESSQSPVTGSETKPASDRASAASAATLEKINGLIAESTSLREQLDDRKQQYLRLYADFENFRKKYNKDLSKYLFIELENINDAIKEIIIY